MVNTLTLSAQRSSASRFYGMLQLACNHHHHHHHHYPYHDRENIHIHSHTSRRRTTLNMCSCVNNLRTVTNLNETTATTSSAMQQLLRISSAGTKAIRRSISGAASSSASQAQSTQEEGLMGGLYVVATPIGNLKDLSFRALQVLEECDEVLCEDTRRTIKLLSHYEIRGKRLSSYHEHNKKSRKHKETLETLRLNPFRKIALVCDAGTPTVSDPGSDLVREAREMGVKVHCIPGPCAFAAALSASGITRSASSSASSFSSASASASGLDIHFVGFLPEKSKAMRRKLSQMAELEAVHVMYVAPHDLVKQLKAIGETFGQNTKLVLARELTKVYEEFWKGSVSEAVEEFTVRRQPKGEFTVLVDNHHDLKSSSAGDSDSKEREGDVPPLDEKVEKVLRALIASGIPASEAVRVVCSISQQPLKKKDVYNAAMQLKQQPNK